MTLNLTTEVSGGAASNALSGLIPGYEARRIMASARFAPRPAGGSTQRLKTPGRVSEETRQYQAGDPVHLIDWRAFGRTDQLILRQRREQAPQHVRIQVGLHDSMYWPGSWPELKSEISSAPGTLPHAVINKSELAWRLALFMAYALLRRGDVVEIEVLLGSGLNSDHATIWRPSGARMVMDLFDWLKVNNFSPDAVAKIVLPEVSPLRDVRRSSRIRRVALTDALGDNHGISALEPGDLFLHVLSELEISDAWRSAGDVYADESNSTASLAANEWQGQWLQDHIGPARQAWFDRLDQALAARGCEAARVTGVVPVDAFIVVFESWCGGVR